MNEYDVLIIGGGQSALACAYFLRRTALSYLILDDQPSSDGAWQHGWDSLTLFSPAEYSSLPGWMMPKSGGKFPLRQEGIGYIHAVWAVHKTETGFEVETSAGQFKSTVVISATGSWQNPFIPPCTRNRIISGYSNPFRTL